MNHGEPPIHHSLPPTKARFLHARSLPTKRPFNIAVFFSGLHYLGLIMTTTALVSFFLEPSPLGRNLFLGGISFSVMTWLVAFFKRRSAYCPLCKGTPLINSGARPHTRAKRIAPFSHGVSATLSILSTQTFRCMYCGSDFDLLKTSSHLRGAKTDAPRE
jgi:hypothetical protein